MVSGQRVHPTLLSARRTMRQKGPIFHFQLPQPPPPLLHHVEASEPLPSKIESDIHDSSLWYPFDTDAPIFTYLTTSQIARPLI